jgi:hypothetical protein
MRLRHEQFRKRIVALERRLADPEPVWHTMQDGQEIPLQLPKTGILGLFSYLLDNPDSAEAEKVRSAVSIVEPKNSHLLEVFLACPPQLLYVRNSSGSDADGNSGAVSPAMTDPVTPPDLPMPES